MGWSETQYDQVLEEQQEELVALRTQVTELHDSLAWNIRQREAIEQRYAALIRSFDEYMQAYHEHDSVTCSECNPPIHEHT